MMVTVTLSKPLKLDDQEIKEIKMDLENIKGTDIISISRELSTEGKRFNILDVETQLKIAARASGMIPEDLERLHYPDFLDVTGNVQLFLMNWGLEDQETSKKSV